MLWTFFWFVLVHDTPSQHPRISVKEKEYITRSINLQKKKKVSLLKLFVKPNSFCKLVVIYFKKKEKNNLLGDKVFCSAKKYIQNIFLNNKYIENNPLKVINFYNNICFLFKTEKRQTPWLQMLKSGPLWAILCGHFASNWGNYTLMTLLPTYMTHVLKFNIKSVSKQNYLGKINHQSNYKF